MSGGGLSYGLNFTKKTKSSAARPQPAKRNTVFGDDDESDGETKGSEIGVEEIGEIGDLSRNQSGLYPPPETSKSKPGGPKKPPSSMFGDLSASFLSKKHAATAQELDANVNEYDAIYDSLKPQNKITQEDKERKPKYMKKLIDAAAVRKRDANIAEEKKLARDREAEGDEYADKEKFVTSAYKKQQEENRRLEAEEKVREAEEEKKNKGTGMANFYKSMLDRGEQKHAEVVKAVEERIKEGPKDDIDEEKPKTDADIAREINEKSANSIAINDEGQVVDKRQLLKGGLNIVPKAKAATPATTSGGGTSTSNSSGGSNFVGSGGGKQAMRERQSRMMEAQLEQATKRALDQEEEDKKKVERASKSRKTEGDIMSAKERYLARKQEAEEAKKRGVS